MQTGLAGVQGDVTSIKPIPSEQIKVVTFHMKNANPFLQISGKGRLLAILRTNYCIVDVMIDGKKLMHLAGDVSNMGSYVCNDYYKGMTSGGGNYTQHAGITSFGAVDVGSNKNTPQAVSYFDGITPIAGDAIGLYVSLEPIRFNTELKITNPDNSHATMTIAYTLDQ